MLATNAVESGWHMFGLTPSQLRKDVQEALAQGLVLEDGRLIKIYRLDQGRLFILRRTRTGDLLLLDCRKAGR